MAFSTQRATSDGTLSLLDISIEYFDRSEIAVLYDGVLQTSGWSWIGTTDKKVSFSPPVPNGVEVMLVRTTDLESVRHVFTLGAAFTTQSLDEDLKQILHIAQEAKENATIEEVFHNLNMHGYRLVNVGPGIADTDGANMLQMNTAVGIAQTAAIEAANSAATINVANLLSKAANLSDVSNPSTARANLGAQSTLISGTNIKTVNGASILGSGDIAIAIATSIPDGDKGDIVVSSAGTVWTIDNSSVTPAKMSQPLTLGTAQATTSGTAVDFTGIPSWVKRITVSLAGVSTNGSATFILRLGSGAIQASGYASGASMGSAVAQASDGFIVSANQGPAGIYNGSCILTLMSGNTWVMSSNVITPNSVGTSGAGVVTLTGGVDRVRLTTGNGTDLFDGGSINILYE